MFGVIELGTEHVDESTEGRLSRRLVVLRSPDLEIVVVTCGGHREEAPHTVRIEGSDAVPGEHCRVVAKYKEGRIKYSACIVCGLKTQMTMSPGHRQGTRRYAFLTSSLP